MSIHSKQDRTPKYLLVSKAHSQPESTNPFRTDGVFRQWDVVPTSPAIIMWELGKIILWPSVSPSINAHVSPAATETGTVVTKKTWLLAAVIGRGPRIRVPIWWRRTINCTSTTLVMVSFVHFQQPTMIIGLDPRSLVAEASDPSPEPRNQNYSMASLRNPRSSE